MSKKRQAYGRSAFPYSLNRFTGDEDNGMTYRQWLAGMALSGLTSNPHGTVEKAVRFAVECADALIVELDEEEP